ncbi:hypothetical protein Egran_01586 [Elaphomyces granulatus]|uniref:Uncharacterized protein n=1 Tax=Elaphomyces granulatus TaxID=519963 RepID=A0A232M2X1_9EURO|nr:hypothetical protein Egran_01586 [Elaphomyces granulatus]
MSQTPVYSLTYLAKRQLVTWRRLPEIKSMHLTIDDLPVPEIHRPNQSAHPGSNQPSLSTAQFTSPSVRQPNGAVITSRLTPFDCSGVWRKASSPDDRTLIAI